MTDTKTIDRLETELADFENRPKDDPHLKIDIINDLAWALRDIDLKRAMSLGEKAQALAESPDDARLRYPLGVAYSLRTLGYLNFRLGNYSSSFSQSIEAQQIFESLEHLDGLPEVFENIASVYTHTGNIPGAAEYFHKQFDAAQHLNDKERIANASNNLASLHHDVGEIERAIETYRKSLKIAIEIDYKRLQVMCLYNLAACYLNQNDAEKTLENGRASLRISREEGFELFEIYALIVIGEAYLKINDAAKTLDALKQALPLSKKLDATHALMYILEGMARAYRAQQNMDRALDCLYQSIALAESIDDKREIFKPHLLASEIYEQQGDLAKALQHFKQYQKYREVVLEDKANQQRQILQVAHDTETARKEAEMLQQKTEVLQEAHDQLEQRVQERTTDLNRTVQLLQQEITERRRVETELQQLTEELEERLIARTRELAAFFDLATLGSSGDDLTHILSPTITHILSAGHCHAFCLHLLDPATQILRLVVTDGISPDVETPLQQITITEPFTGYLNQDGSHLAITDLQYSTLLPNELKLSGFQAYLGTQLRTQGRTLGWLSCYRHVEESFSLDEISLLVALAEQLVVIIENHRLREQAEAMAVLQERQRLARDLHDSINQSLYGLTLLARSGVEAAAEGNTTRLQTSLTDLEASSFQILREMRLLLFQLRPQALDQTGLVEALLLRLNAIERRTGMTVTYQGDDEISLPSDIEAELYHLAMEALNNVLKHAQASHVTVNLTTAANRLKLVIKDNGQGFDPSKTAGGFGLQSMRERAARLNAQLKLTTETDIGTRIEVVLPVDYDGD